MFTFKILMLLLSELMVNVKLWLPLVTVVEFPVGKEMTELNLVEEQVPLVFADISKLLVVRFAITIFPLKQQHPVALQLVLVAKVPAHDCAWMVMMVNVRKMRATLNSMFLSIKTTAK